MRTLPKRWIEEGWVDLGSDVNWEGYHGMWGKKCNNLWYVLQFTNIEDACGENEAIMLGIFYECKLKIIDLTQISQEIIQRAKESIYAPKINILEEAIIYCLIQDGYGAPVHTSSGSSYPRRVRAEAKREADNFMRDCGSLEKALNKVVNALGTTAKEYGSGDVLAGLRRYKEGNEPRDPEKDLMLKLQTSQVKSIRQNNLSAECIAVQIWGTEQCQSCEYKDSPDCGGQEIRKTGVNEKGIEVGKTGL